MKNQKLNIISKEYIKLEEMNKDILFHKYIDELLYSNAVQSMKQYIQHGSTTTFEHCLNVSYISYKIAKKFNLDAKSTARAALLHDLFLYDWHYQEKKPLFEKHGFTHPKTALNNACKYFCLNDIEKDIISKHMWPLTIRQVPKYKESIIVTSVDKYCSTKETFAPLFSKTLLKKWNLNNLLNLFKITIDN